MKYRVREQVFYLIFLKLVVQLSYHKFNESQREAAILRRLQEGQTVALISDAGTPGISDPGAELVCFPVQKFCSNYLFTIELLHKKKNILFYLRFINFTYHYDFYSEINFSSIPRKLIQNVKFFVPLNFLSSAAD